MKVQIDEKGKLSVVAETPMESYALSHWFANYGQGNDSSVLAVETTIREEDGS